MSRSGPSDDRTVRARLAEIWRGFLDVPTVHDDSDWFELDGGLRFVPMFDAVRECLGVDLPYPVLYRDSRLGELAETVSRGRALPDIHHRIPLRSGSRQPLLVYVPGVFGEDLHALHDLRSLEHEVLFLRAPGLDEGGEPLRTLPELARFYLELTLPVVGDRPVVLAGFSAGGTIAIEMARLAKERGWKPHGVILIDTLPPAEGFDDLDDEDLMAFRLQTLLDREAAITGAEPPQCLGRALDARLTAEVTVYLHEHRSRSLPRGMGWSIMERQLRVYATGMRAANTHEPSMCDVPVGYLRCAEGRELEVDWESVSAAGYSTFDAPSTHSTLWYDDVVPEALAHFLELMA